MTTGLVFQYRAADAYQLADNLWEDGGLVVRGEASATVRCEPGTFVLPRYAPARGGLIAAQNQTPKMLGRIRYCRAARTAASSSGPQLLLGPNQKGIRKHRGEFNF